MAVSQNGNGQRMQEHMNADLILSCDWGTSAFRLRIADVHSGKITGEVISPHGNAAIFKKWNEQQSPDRISFYLQYLKDSLTVLSDKTGALLNDCPIVISGMASSSIGLKELPYAELPFAIDGSNVEAEWLNEQTVLENKLLLISGLGTAEDVLRGEETQLIGIADTVHTDNREEITYIFPGTHSKYITVRNKKIVHFETYMTGEIFSLLVEHSILGQSVTGSPGSPFTTDESEAFQAGIKKAGESHLLSSLFSVRVKQLRDHFSKVQGYFYLSGLLIGTELKNMQDKNRGRLIVCSGNKINHLYWQALQYPGLKERISFVSSAIADHAAVAGHIKILKKFL